MQTRALERGGGSGGGSGGREDGGARSAGPAGAGRRTLAGAHS